MNKEEYKQQTVQDTHFSKDGVPPSPSDMSESESLVITGDR